MKLQLLTTAAIVTGILTALLVAQEGKRDEAPKKPERLAIGTAFPAGKSEMEGTDGKKYTLDGSAGEKGTLVVFTCNSCPVVVKWEKRITAISNEYKKKGFGVVLINSNDPAVGKGDDMDGMKERGKKLALEVPYVMDADSSVARAFGASKTPEVFLFDKEKKLVYWGAVDDNADSGDDVKKHYLKDALEAVSAGKKPETAETKALGCTIKFRAKKSDS